MGTPFHVGPAAASGGGSRDLRCFAGESFDDEEEDGGGGGAAAAARDTARSDAAAGVGATTGTGSATTRDAAGAAAGAAAAARGAGLERVLGICGEPAAATAGAAGFRAGIGACFDAGFSFGADTAFASACAAAVGAAISAAGAGSGGGAGRDDFLRCCLGGGGFSDDDAVTDMLFGRGFAASTNFPARIAARTDFATPDLGRVRRDGGRGGGGSLIDVRLFSGGNQYEVSVLYLHTRFLHIGCVAPTKVYQWVTPRSGAAQISRSSTNPRQAQALRHATIHAAHWQNQADGLLRPHSWITLFHK